MGPLVLLRTPGRRTGLRRTVPVALIGHDHLEWLVSPFGATQWVRNLRADRRAELGRGRRFRTVELVEINDDRKPAVLEQYRVTRGGVPFVRRAFTLPPATAQRPSGRKRTATRSSSSSLPPDPWTGIGGRAFTCPVSG